MWRPAGHTQTTARLTRKAPFSACDLAFSTPHYLSKNLYNGGWRTQGANSSGFPWCQPIPSVSGGHSEICHREQAAALALLSSHLVKCIQQNKHFTLFSVLVFEMAGPHTQTGPPGGLGVSASKQLAWPVAPTGFRPGKSAPELRGLTLPRPRHKPGTRATVPAGAARRPAPLSQEVPAGQVPDMSVTHSKQKLSKASSLSKGV